MTNLRDTFRQRLAGFPPVGLIAGPTPLTRLNRLSERMNGPDIWIKRDDATHISSGGNKMRKLDRVLHEAVLAGCDTLVSGGVAQSNSQRQVASAAAILGLECHLAVYEGRVSPPSTAYSVSGNVVLNTLFGAHMHNVSWAGDRNQAIHALSDELRSKGRKPFVVPYGVSSAMGALSYSSVVLEIADQCAEQGFVPDAIYAASGSGGTQSGLIVGAMNCLPDTAIIGVDVDAEPKRVRVDVERFTREACSLLETDYQSGWIELAEGYAGPGYGVIDDETIRAMKEIAQTEAIILDPVYSGKAMAALLGDLQSGRWKSGDHIVFVHTGGMPSVFAYAEQIG